MSSALVQKALEIVDPDFRKQAKVKKSKNNTKDVFNLIPDKLKITKNISRKGRKEKTGVLSTSKKLTVLEAKKTFKSKDEILKENLKKLKEIKNVCTIELDKETTEKIIQRAVTRRPVKEKKKRKKTQTTVFTEEDFKKFEEEYTG
ncbi:active regulator of SIRT1 [Tribolium castaneum]|uniref:active regulator of SIRT1 n=1 Tax=Tribolium castaneum TaxID=7070 RepID=UPI0030FF0D11